jgi:serine/threonine protein phosphatase PrpC
LTVSRVFAAVRVVRAASDQDRVARHAQDNSETIILADGAGGMAGGREAAELVGARAKLGLADPEACVTELRRLDTVLHDTVSAGETTCVLLVVRGDSYFGASVGDSCLWALHSGACIEITRDQVRKPLLGSGMAKPVGFGPRPFNGRLLLASDGLYKYVPFKVMEQLALQSPLPKAADALVEAARLPSGDLQDDVAVVLLEPERK